jgi:hypothetical protein
MRLGTRCVAGSAAWLLAALGCSGQTETQNAAPAVGAQWSCLDRPSVKPSPLPDVTYSAKVVEWPNGGTPDGMTVCVCDLIDLRSVGDGECTQPLSPSGCVHPTESNVAVILPGTSSYALQFLAPGAVPIALYFGNMPVKDVSPSSPIRMMSPLGLAAIANGFSLHLDPTKGVVLLRVFDCDGDPAVGVLASLSTADPLTIQFGYVDGEAKPWVRETDSSGTFLFENVATGPVLITAVTNTGLVLGEFALDVRSGRMTALDLRQ